MKEIQSLLEFVKRNHDCLDEALGVKVEVEAENNIKDAD